MVLEFSLHLLYISMLNIFRAFFKKCSVACKTYITIDFSWHLVLITQYCKVQLCEHGKFGRIFWEYTIN